MHWSFVSDILLLNLIICVCCSISVQRTGTWQPRSPVIMAFLSTTPTTCRRQIQCVYDLRNVHTVYPKKYAHGFVVLCFVVVMQSFIMNSHEVSIHIHQGCFAGTGAIVRLPQCQWSKPDGYGKISQCITTTKHSKAKTVCIFHGIYCSGSFFYKRCFILTEHACIYWS